MYKIIALILFISLNVLFTSCNTKEEKYKPNIIFIMVDDLGYADLSSFGNKNLKTQNIDAFVNQGLKFTNAYAAAPFCSPTRVAFMTGKYPGKYEIGLREPLTLSENDLKLGLSSGIPTLTSILKENNYETALFGKWHLGQTEEYLPSKHGVDHFFGIMCGAADHIDHKPFDRNRDLLFKRDIPNLFENDVAVTKKGYLNNLITDYSIDFISKEHKAPFFLSVQFTAPHWPWQSPTDPASDSLSYALSGDLKTYESMLSNLDENFGKIMEALKNSNLQDSTLVIFTNDNGGARFANQGKLKGKKGSLDEGGIRVPAAVRWPSVTIPNSVTEQLVITMDWTKTILDAANCKMPMKSDFDGINLKKYLENPSLNDDRTLFWRITNRKQELAVRKGGYKYIENKEGEFLYNLDNDISESKDLKKSESKIFQDLKFEGEKFRNEILNPLDYK